MGVWIDLYDDAAWADPGGRGRRHGRARRAHVVPGDLELPPAVPVRGQAGRGGVRRRGARARGRVVAWYLPGFVDVGLDAKRSKAAIRFRRMRATGSTGSRWTSRRRMSPTPMCGPRGCWTSRIALRTFAGETLPARRHRPVAARDRGAQGLLAGVPVRGPRRGLRRDHADVVLHVAPPDGRQHAPVLSRRTSGSSGARWGATRCRST